ncbi:MAG: hypothetical protein AAGG51_06870 [Cyanobacteria bacterium P01_G01_bin.54]
MTIVTFVKSVSIPTAASALALLSLSGLPANAASFTNGIYTVNVSEGSSNGSWNAITGSAHPAGGGRNLMYRGSNTTTNFSSLRIFDGASSQDYTFSGSGGSTSLDSYVSFEGDSIFADEGFRTAWDLTPESLDIVQDVFLVGGDYDSSAIYHTVEITNNGSQSVSLGWRNLYDWDISGSGLSSDDGPSNQVESADGTIVVPTTTNEFSYQPQGADFVRVSRHPGTPTYEPLLSLGFDPNFVPALPITTPTEYAYTSWRSAFNSAFDYATNSSRNVTGDSAGLTWFGRDAATAYNLAAGESVRFNQVIFAVLPDDPIPNDVPEPSSLLGLAVFASLGIRRVYRSNQEN